MRQSITVYELAPAADELWELETDASKGCLWHRDGEVALPDVASGAKLRPHVSAAYASGKATNIARVFDAFLRSNARSEIARRARLSVRAQLVTFLPGQPGGYRNPGIPGALLQRFTPGGAYLACLQARDFSAVDLSLEVLPATDGIQTDRRCVNVVARDGGELCNFSPYLLWSRACVDTVLKAIASGPVADFVGLAGSLPLVEGAAAPDIYARVIRAIRSRRPDTVISLDVGGAPLAKCLQPGAMPDVVCVNMDEYGAVPPQAWKGFGGLIAVHDKRGCWLLRREAPSPEALARRGPDVPVPGRVSVVHTICAGDAAHGGLLLGLMLYGTGRRGVGQAAVLSQACALTVVESRDSIRGLTASRVQSNLRRFATTSPIKVQA